MPRVSVVQLVSSIRTLLLAPKCDVSLAGLCVDVLFNTPSQACGLLFDIEVARRMRPSPPHPGSNRPTRRQASPATWHLASPSATGTPRTGGGVSATGHNMTAPSKGVVTEKVWQHGTLVQATTQTNDPAAAKQFQSITAPGVLGKCAHSAQRRQPTMTRRPSWMRSWPCPCRPPRSPCSTPSSTACSPRCGVAHYRGIEVHCSSETLARCRLPRRR